MPLQGVPAVIEIYGEFLEGLRGTEEDTHINVIGWFDRAERGPLVVTPRKIRKINPKLGKRGVFSLRSPVRPNPLSLSVTRLLRVETPLLYVEALDLIDASPIIDIKPYSAGWDAVFWARDKHSCLVAQDAVSEEAFAALTREAYNFHGERCAATAAAARIVYDAAIELESDLRDLTLELPRNADPHLVDSLIGTTRATPGNARLSICGDTREVIISSLGRSISYRLLDILDWDPTRILSSPPETLFERVG
ncbi:MAG: tRNA (N6-threonylcarbamoyladenosine(37)-N6)-methyltransferase TrmO [Euryarchaeota archaeon]|nr:tRNA (N6-threonylcarbamoyladenosine(37)-N6)-methyltransferase TrmO [Euryarchaeota archaeon]